MADIDLYLKAIRSAVYGEEVRGSIYDAISKINESMSEILPDIEGILNKFATSINYDISSGIYYDCSTNDDGTIGTELWTDESQNHESVILQVIPGETYKITCYRYILGVLPGISWPVIAAKKNGSDYLIKDGCGKPFHEYTYIYTIPDGVDTLLISSICNSLGSIDIRKMNTNQTGCVKKIWSGALYTNASNVNFYVPEKYWHDENLTLLIDCVRFQSDDSSLSTYPHAKTVLMCLSRYHRLFATSDGGNYYSGTYAGDGKISLGNVYESFTDKSGGCNSNIDIQAYVRPLVTTEYALVNVAKLDSTDYAITSIYAVVPIEEG